MKVLFTCGGTAGHINPAVALAGMFRQRQNAEVLFVGADGGMETTLVPREGYPVKTVTITSFYRSLSGAAIKHNLTTLKNLSRSKGQARAILDEFRPDLVVGTGGYASYPVVREAARRGIPTAVHESNAEPGLTTKMLALRRAASTIPTRSEWWSPAPRSGASSSTAPGKRPAQSWALPPGTPSRWWSPAGALWARR